MVIRFKKVLWNQFNSKFITLTVIFKETLERIMVFSFKFTTLNVQYSSLSLNLYINIYIWVSIRLCILIKYKMYNTGVSKVYF